MVWSEPCYLLPQILCPFSWHWLLGDQLTPGKSGRYFIYFYFFLSLYVSLLSIIIIFGVGNLFNFFCLFVLVCFAFFVIVLFYFSFFVCLFCSVVVVFVCFFCFGLSCSPLRHFPSVFYFFVPIAVTSYKHCVNISASYTSVLGVISWVVGYVFT